MRRAALLCLAFALTVFVPLGRAQEGHAPSKSPEPAKAGEQPAAHEPAKAHETPGEGAGHEAAAGHEGPGGHAAGGHEGLELWKWANFLLLAAGLGYLIGKNAGPFFSARSQQIRKNMVEAQEARRHAEARAAEVDRRLASLDTEIAALKAEAQSEVQAETERLARHATAEIDKIRRHADQEIVFAGKAARTELKRYSAQLAVSLAEQRIRARMTPETQQALIRGFVRDLEPPPSRATT
jgi:F-type H+-transporting ATPase subunit b